MKSQTSVLVQEYHSCKHTDKCTSIFFKYHKTIDVTPEVSEGKCSKDWIQKDWIINKKWKGVLPLLRVLFTPESNKACINIYLNQTGHNL